MMKKILALLVSAVLLMSCTAALAETVRLMEDSPDFDVEIELPEGAALQDNQAYEAVTIATLTGKDVASVHLTIAASDIYDMQSLADLSEEDRQIVVDLAGQDFENPSLTQEVTPSGYQYIHVCSNSEGSDIDAICTLYKGYFIQLSQWHDDYSAITDADYAFMQSLLYGLNIIDVQ